MLENKKDFQQHTVQKEAIASPNENMDKFNQNNKTVIKTEKKIDDKKVLDTKEVSSNVAQAPLREVKEVRTTVTTEAPRVIEHVDKAIIKQEQLPTAVQQHAVAHDVIEHMEKPVVEQSHRNVVHEHH